MVSYAKMTPREREAYCKKSMRESELREQRDRKRNIAARRYIGFTPFDRVHNVSSLMR